MNTLFLLRIVLNCMAAGLLLFAFAYYWQGNGAHELAGLGMFLLLIAHNLFHRRWFATLSKKTIRARGPFNLALTFVLLAGMLALLGTSMMISETLFASWRLADDFTARQIHAGLAYWLLLVVAVHLGLRWPMLMTFGRKLAGIARPNRARTALLRMVTAAIAVQGLFSAAVLDLRTRLLFQMSLDWWNFEQSVAGFFLHCTAVAGLCMCLAYYTTQWSQGRTVQAVTRA